MVSILTPIHNTNVALLAMCLESVKNQTYEEWEWCITNDGSTDNATINFLNSIDHPKIKIINLPTNVGIGEATQRAFEISKGEYIAFIDSDDELTADALELSVKTLRETNSDMVYSDEALLSMDGKLSGVHYKPDFSPDMLLSQNYICHFVMLKRELYEQAGGLRGGYDGAQDHDFLLRVVEKTDKVAHISKVLYLWRIVQSSITHDNSSKNAVWERGKSCIETALKRRHGGGSVDFGKSFGNYSLKRDVIGNPIVSIIIPYKDNIINLEKCIREILIKSTYRNVELIVVSNVEDTQNKLNRISGKAKIVYTNEGFNYGKFLNAGVDVAQGEHIIITHDDFEPINENWIECLLDHSQRSEVGAVGGKLLFPNNTIQHTNYFVKGPEIVIYPYKNQSSSYAGYYNRAINIQNVSSVSDACMMFKKSVYEEIDKFNDKELIIDFADVDFCLRLYEKGYYNVFTPLCRGTHKESKNKGSIISVRERNEIKQQDKRYMLQRHSEILKKGDPFYNINFNLSPVFSYPALSMDNNKIISAISNETRNNINQIRGERPNIQQRNALLESANKKSDVVDTSRLVSFIIPIYDCYPVAVASILSQTYPNYEILLIHDGPMSIKTEEMLDDFRKHSNKIKVMKTDKRYNDVGHTPRSYGLTRVSEKSDLIVFTGADNYYIPKFLEYMVLPFTNSKVLGAYCNCLHNYWDWNLINTRLVFGSIDCGCFMVRTPIARKIGWKHRVHEADWLFIKEMLKIYGRGAISKVPKTLFIHN